MANIGLCFCFVTLQSLTSSDDISNKCNLKEIQIPLPHNIAEIRKSVYISFVSFFILQLLRIELHVNLLHGNKNEDWDKEGYRYSFILKKINADKGNLDTVQILKSNCSPRIIPLLFSIWIYDRLQSASKFIIGTSIINPDWKQRETILYTVSANSVLRHPDCICKLTS